MKNIVFFPLYLFILISCSSPEKLTKRNISYIYSQDPTALYPLYKIYHFHPDSSRLYIFIKTSQLLYQKAPGDTFYQCEVECLIIQNLATGPDTIKRIIHDKRGQLSEEWLISWIDFSLSAGQKLPLSVTIIDKKRETFFSFSALMDKTHNGNEQFFLLKDKYGAFFIENFASSRFLDTVLLESALCEKIYIQYLKDETPPPLPPFVMETLQPQLSPIAIDSIICRKEPCLIPLKEHYGIISFKTSPSSSQGLHFYTGYSSYPKPTDIYHLIKSMRYITSAKEYELLENAFHPKEQLDNFWLKTTGSYARSAELIKEYFSRVENANLLFTSYTEGWKTERGIIYIIFGPPDFIYKNQTTERWIYGQENYSLSYAFDFKQNENSPFKNDFYLIRDEQYKPLWYRYVEYWRTGKMPLNF